MRSALIPVLLLLVLPALYLSRRLAWPRSPAARWTAGILLVACVLWSLPYDGLDFLYIKYFNLFLAAAVAVALMLAHFDAGGFRQVTRSWPVLGATAVLAVTIYTNFFAFHGLRTFVHYHDVAHYYLGSKYYAEAGYHDLYTAMLRAEAETYDNHFKTVTARDLRTYEEVSIVPLLRRSDTVKAAFDPERWAEFKRDVAYFRGALGEHYGGVLHDHGFNPTPVWALMGGVLSRQVPAGSARGILLLCLLDVALLVATFGAMAWAFGARAMLLALIHFCVIFGTGLGWTGGAFLRFLWFFGLVGGICCLKRRRPVAAGALLGLAASLRIFPLFFVLPVAFKGAALAWSRRRWPKRQASFVASFLVTAGVLVTATGWLPRGFDHWRDFHKQMTLHVASIAPNIIGLTEILAYQPGEAKLSQDELDARKRRRQRIYTVQLLFLFLPLLFASARFSRPQTDVGAILLGLPLLLAGLSLAAYYYAFLVLLVLWRRQSDRDLALIFVVEAASYTFLLFENREGLLYIYRAVTLFLLYAALYIPTLFRRQVHPGATFPDGALSTNP